MYKTELIRRVAKKTKLSHHTVALVMNTSTQAIQESLEKGRDVHLTGFGTFYTRMRGEAEALNFTTGAKIRVPKMRLPAFRAGTLLKRAVRKK